MNRKGFTLIELLIVVVIIGILAAIAIPKFASTKEKAYVASMKADLRNLATAQEAYLSSVNPPSYFTWSGDNTAGGYTPAGATSAIYTPSSGVTVATAPPASGGGWTATATHAQTTVTCDIFIAPATSPGISKVEGEPTCK